MLVGNQPVSIFSNLVGACIWVDWAASYLSLRLSCAAPRAVIEGATEVAVPPMLLPAFAAIRYFVFLDAKCSKSKRS